MSYLKFISGQYKLNSRHAKWVEFLQSFSFVSKYKPRHTNVVANALSRMPDINSLLFMEIKGSFLESLKGKYEHDEAYSKVWSYVSQRDPSPTIADGVGTSSSTHHSPPSSDELTR